MLRFLTWSLRHSHARNFILGRNGRLTCPKCSRTFGEKLYVREPKHKK